MTPNRIHNTSSVARYEHFFNASFSSATVS